VIATTLRGVGACAYFAADCFVSLLRHGAPWDRFANECWKVSIRALPVLVTMAIFVGTNLAIQGHAAFQTLGAGSIVGMFVALAGVREVCPLLAATMVAAKAGTEMTAQLAVMRTKEQIDAISVMALDEKSELVVPSVLAIVLMLPVLTVLSIGVAVVAAYLVATQQLHVDEGEFLGMLLRHVAPFDLVAAAVKATVFGVIIATVSGYFGFFSERGAKGVGQATNRAVVTMCVVVICVNFALTSFLYG
jgi:phospholipid/cholesterol/gamma-HCH transport system permease protein